MVKENRISQFRMPFGIFLGLVVILGFIGHTSVAMASDVISPAGYWLTKKQDVVIKIENCDQSLCGTIYWLKDDVMMYDDSNPDPNLRGRPLCNIDVLWGMEQDKRNPNFWKSGKIYKADDGEFFGAQIKMNDPDFMNLRGYIGMPFIGKTSVFTRVNPSDYKQCDPSIDRENDAKELGAEQKGQVIKNQSVHLMRDASQMDDFGATKNAPHKRASDYQLND